MKTEINAIWEHVKIEFPRNFAEQISQEILEIETIADARIILRTLRAKGKTIAQLTAIRIFNRALKAILLNL